MYFFVLICVFSNTSKKKKNHCYNHIEILFTTCRPTSYLTICHKSIECNYFLIHVYNYFILQIFAMLHTRHTTREWWAVAIERSFKYPALTRGTTFGSRSHLHSHVAIVTLWFVGGYYAYIKYVRRGQSLPGIVWRALIPSKKKFASFALFIYCTSSFK